MTVRRAMIAVCLPWSCCAAGTGQSVTLPRRLPPGRYVISAVTDRQQRLTVKKRARPRLRTAMTQVLAAVVDAPDEAGRAKVRLTFRRLAYSFTTRGKTLAYDSADARAEPSRLQRLLEPLTKATVEAVINPNGHVGEVKGLDAVWDAHAKDNPGVDRWANQIKAEMGDDMIVRLLEQVPRLLPGEPVSAERAWQGEMRFRLPYVGERKRFFTLRLARLDRRSDPPVAVVSLDERFYERRTTVVNIPPTPLTVKSLQVKQSGELRLGVTSGVPIQLTLQRSSVLTMSGTDPAGGSRTVQLGHTYSSRVTIGPDTAAPAAEE